MFPCRTFFFFEFGIWSARAYFFHSRTRYEGREEACECPHVSTEHAREHAREPAREFMIIGWSLHRLHRFPERL